MKSLHFALSRPSFALADPRVVAIARLLVLGALVLLPTLAAAYPGEQMVMWARSSIVAPLCFFAILTSILVACFRPQLAIGAVFVTIASLFVMWVMSNGAAVTSQLQGSN